MSEKIAVLTLWAEDVLAAVHFYRDVLGLKLLPHHGDRPHFDVDGTYLVILKGQLPPAKNAEPPSFPLFAISVDDLNAMIARLEHHQISLFHRIESNESSRWVMFHDPAGNLIELVEFKS